MSFGMKIYSLACLLLLGAACGHELADESIEAEAIKAQDAAQTTAEFSPTAFNDDQQKKEPTKFMTQCNSTKTCRDSADIIRTAFAVKGACTITSVGAVRSLFDLDPRVALTCGDEKTSIHVGSCFLGCFIGSAGTTIGIAFVDDIEKCMTKICTDSYPGE